MRQSDHISPDTVPAFLRGDRITPEGKKALGIDKEERKQVNIANDLVELSHKFPDLNRKKLTLIWLYRQFKQAVPEATDLEIALAIKRIADDPDEFDSILEQE